MVNDGGPLGGPQDHVPGDPQDRLPGDGYGEGGDRGRGYGGDDPRVVASGGRFRAFPFPSYSTRTRRGTQVTVGGCCLPLPIGCLTVLAAAGAAAVAAHRR